MADYTDKIKSIAEKMRVLTRAVEEELKATGGFNSPVLQLAYDLSFDIDSINTPFYKLVPNTEALGLPPAAVVPAPQPKAAPVRPAGPTYSSAEGKCIVIGDANARDGRTTALEFARFIEEPMVEMDANKFLMRYYNKARAQLPDEAEYKNPKAVFVLLPGLVSGVAGDDQLVQVKKADYEYFEKVRSTFKKNTPYRTLNVVMVVAANYTMDQSYGVPPKGWQFRWYGARSTGEIERRSDVVVLPMSGNRITESGTITEQVRRDVKRQCGKGGGSSRINQTSAVGGGSGGGGGGGGPVVSRTQSSTVNKYGVENDVWEYMEPSAKETVIGRHKANMLLRSATSMEEILDIHNKYRTTMLDIQNATQTALKNETLTFEGKNIAREIIPTLENPSQMILTFAKDQEDGSYKMYAEPVNQDYHLEYYYDDHVSIDLRGDDFLLKEDDLYNIAQEYYIFAKPVPKVGEKYPTLAALYAHARYKGRPVQNEVRQWYNRKKEKYRLRRLDNDKVYENFGVFLMIGKYGISFKFGSKQDQFDSDDLETLVYYYFETYAELKRALIE